MHDVSASAGIAVESTDVSQAFVLADGAFRGRLVRLSRSVTDILTRHNDPEPVAQLLCEALVSAVALAGGIKYDGVFTLQAQGKGPVRTLVADITSEGKLRGWAQYDRDALAPVLAKGRPENLAPHLLGQGYLAFTVDQGPDTERYQGIVELGASSLADAVHNYFRQSEQIASALMVAVAPPDPSTGQAEWRAAALVLQRMPEIGGKAVLSDDEAEDAWRTAVVLMGSATKQELLNPALPPNQVLYRLFATMGVRSPGPKLVSFGCRCSRARSERILASFPVEEVKSLAEADGSVHMTCEFCRTAYVFTAAEVDAFATRESQDNETQVSP